MNNRRHLRAVASAAMVPALLVFSATDSVARARSASPPILPLDGWISGPMTLHVEVCPTNARLGDIIRPAPFTVRSEILPGASVSVGQEYAIKVQVIGHGIPIIHSLQMNVSPDMKLKTVKEVMEPHNSRPPLWTWTSDGQLITITLPEDSHELNAILEFAPPDSPGSLTFEPSLKISDAAGAQSTVRYSPRSFDVP